MNDALKAYGIPKCVDCIKLYACRKSTRQVNEDGEVENCFAPKPQPAVEPETKKAAHTECVGCRRAIYDKCHFRSMENWLLKAASNQLEDECLTCFDDSEENNRKNYAPAPQPAPVSAPIPDCDICRKHQSRRGAVMWSPPDGNEKYDKTHICVECYGKMLAPTRTPPPSLGPVLTHIEWAKQRQTDEDHDDPTMAMYWKGYIHGLESQRDRIKSTEQPAPMFTVEQIERIAEWLKTFIRRDGNNNRIDLVNSCLDDAIEMINAELDGINAVTNRKEA